MENRESRVSTSFEVRAEDDGVAVVEGYASVFNEDTNIGGQFLERIAPGAFTDAVTRDDVVFLINHEGLPLARTRSGTLELSEDERGLKMRASLDMTDPDVRAIVPKMRRGDLDKMSFAFVPTRGTEIGLRSLEDFRKSQRITQAPRRLRMKERLQG